MSATSNTISNIESGSSFFENDRSIYGLKKASDKGIENIKGVLKEGAKEALEKAEEIKAKGLSVWNFLKHAGVMAGTAIGVPTIVAVFSTTVANFLAGLVPLSLPALGAIAGCLFAGGVIATIVHNVKDPDAHGAWEVFCNSLSDIFKNIGFGLLELVTSGGSNIKTYVNILQECGKGLEQNISDLKKIATNTKENVSKEVSDGVQVLKNNLVTFKRISQQKDKSLYDIETLKQSQRNITNLTSKLLNDKRTKNTAVQGSTKNLRQILRSIQKNIKSDKLEKSLQELEKSFSKNENSGVSQNGKDPLSSLHISNISINQEVDKSNSSFVNECENVFATGQDQIKQSTENALKTTTEERIDSFVNTFKESSFLKNNYIKVQNGNNSYYFKNFAELDGLITVLEQKNFQLDLKDIFQKINSCVSAILNDKSITNYLTEDARSQLGKIGREAGQIVLDMGKKAPSDGNSTYEVKVQTTQESGFLSWAQYAPQVSINEIIVLYACQ